VTQTSAVEPPRGDVGRVAIARTGALQRTPATSAGSMKRELAASAPSAAAERMRASRARRRQGDVLVSLEVGPSEISNLVALGWLAAPDRTDKQALSRAIVDLVEQAMALHVTRSTGSDTLSPSHATVGAVATEVDVSARLSSNRGPRGEDPSTRGLGLQRPGHGETLGAAEAAAEIVHDKSQEAQPWTEPYDDLVRVWGQRIDLYVRARLWAPEWGPRPGQVDCVAPQQLLEDFGIWPSGLA
jgi:hypothetical protein